MEVNTDVNEGGDTFDPGSARHGNFMNYYRFNSVDSRVRLFPDFMKIVSKTNSNIICLDIGCNTGELTQELHRFVTKSTSGSSSYILGVDMDKILIERANENNKNENITFICSDALAPDFETVCSEYLKQHDREFFDIVFCFSVTMWIHLNHGDKGLKNFIISSSKITRMLVVEPQPWKCYTKAVRRMKRCNTETFEMFEQLKIRKEVEDYIDSLIIKACGFNRVLQTAPTKWGRLINFYKRI